MEITDIQTEGLSREYKLTWSADEIDGLVTSIISTKYRDVNMPGFRPGKAPIKLLKQRFGDAVLREALDQLFDEGTKHLIESKGLENNVGFNSSNDSYEKGKDLAVNILVDLSPEFEPMDFSKISLTELKPVPDDARLDEALGDIAKQNREQEAVKRAAKKGDMVDIDFEGYLNNEAFPGGKAEHSKLEIGAGQFIPGFEENFIGKKAGDSVDFDVDFPSDYQAENLAGKTAHFKCKVHEVLVLKDRAIDDELAKTLGMEDLNQLKSRLKEDYTQRLSAQTSEMMQIKLMDALNDAHDFELPSRMVDREFDNIWPRVKHAMEHDHLDPDDQGKDEATLNADYRKIAQRRVRLGLLLADVAKRGSIAVADDEIQQHMIKRITSMPQETQGQYIQMLSNEQQRNQMMESFKAELLEEKTIGFIKEQATITVEEIPETEIEARLAAESGEAVMVEDSKKAKPKKAAAKKPAAKKESAKKATPEA
ncbi:MAG: trigger factor [Alphaproteobacteria bacterium]